MSQCSPNYQRLLDTPELEGKFELLSSEEAEDCVEWLSNNFSLPYGQIDWSEYEEAVTEALPELDYEDLGRRLSGLWLAADSEVYLVWSDADEVVAFKWQDLTDHLEVLWLPGKEDVWLIPADESGCIELHHEKSLAYLRFDE